LLKRITGNTMYPINNKYFDILFGIIRLSELKRFLISHILVSAEKPAKIALITLNSLIGKAKKQQKPSSPTAITNPTNRLNLISLENSTVAKTKKIPIRILKLHSEYQQANNKIAI